MFWLQITTLAIKTEIMKEFDIQPTIGGEVYSLRPLREEDFSELYTVASDELLWAGHPRKNRYELSEFKEWFSAALGAGSALAIIDNNTLEIMGSSRFYRVSSYSGDISIGHTFISRQLWGGSANAEIKDVMISYASKWFETIWFHISPSNKRSQKAALKIGAIFSHEEYIRLSSNAELWRCYRIDARNYKENS